ncbi:hypothetical protein IT408_02240 [Candidatus Uhrbacteria bacterium]|nr:hypothetical protein [Candidatus Uhrbacteria bacterium]
MDELFSGLDISLIKSFSDNPFEAMWFFFVNGGWIVFVIFFGWAAIHLWKDWRQELYHNKRKFIVLSIRIPRLHEQGPLAVDNMFAYIAGTHSGNSWREEWIDGRTQDTLSFEIVSIDGRIDFVVRAIRQFRDIIEAAVYSQYPDAEINEIEDYTTKVPKDYPDEEWDAWGAEMIPVKSDVYPLRTYPMFEDKVSGEFKDPMAAMLETLGRLGPGEQIWWQIILVPIGQGDFPKKAMETIKKMKGEVAPPKKNFIENALEYPFAILMDVVEAFTGIGGAPKAPPKKEAGQPKIIAMTAGEKDIITAIENKSSKIVYKCKLRFLYIAKKQVMNKAKAVSPFMGAIKQINSNNLLSLKPETKRVGINGSLWWFKDHRNSRRKTLLISAFKKRSPGFGTPPFHLNTEELATLWHFPHSLQVKAPQLNKTEAKRTEPPINLPFG